MECTVLELFRLIVQKRNEVDFYQEGAGLEMEDYLQSITKISPGEKSVIASDCHEEPLNEPISVISGKTVKVDGLMIYYYILHDDEFRFLKIDNDNELYDMMNHYLKNYFIGDLIVFENGKKKNYCVKNEQGEILHHSFGEKNDGDKLVIEWY